MENLMKTSRPKQLFSANVTKSDGLSGSNSSMGTSIPHKSVQNLKREESIGIPIPPRRNNNINNIDDHITPYSSLMNSPPSGRSPTSLTYGSPTMPSSPIQSGYLDVYGGSGSGKVNSRAPSPSPLYVNIGGATGSGDYRLGFKFLFFVLVFFKFNFIYC